MNLMALSASNSMFSGISSDMLLQVLDEIKALIPIVAPAVIGCIALRKGWSFLKSAIKGA